MIKRQRRSTSRPACPLCAEPTPNRSLPPTIAFGIPTYWSPETALAIFEFIDEMRTAILAVHGTHIQDEARRQGQAPPADRVIIPDDELPF
jgi:hypothetical protein